MATTAALSAVDKKVEIGLPERTRARSVDILNAVLADGHLLYVKTRNYHWNVTGPQFHDLHKFFEAQYEELEEAIDAVAERVRSLGGQALGTMREMIEHTSLSEKPGQVPDANGMIHNLLEDHEAVIRTLRKAVDETADDLKDMGTSDFLSGIMEGHEKMAWMLRSSLA